MSVSLAGVPIGDLFLEHADSLARYVARRVVDPVVDDLVQEAFVRAIRYADQYVGDVDGVRSWLTGHAACAVRGYLWSARSYRRAAHAVHQEREPLAGPALPTGDLSDGVLAEALARLPLDLRRVLQLRYLEGLSLDMAAALLGVGPGAVSYRQARGLARLRAELATDGVTGVGVVDPVGAPVSCSRCGDEGWIPGGVIGGRRPRSIPCPSCNPNGGGRS